MLREMLDESPFGRLRAIAVGAVEKGSTAWNIGLRPRDVIMEVNRERVETLADLGRLASAREGIWGLKLRRGSSILSLMSR